MISTKSMVCALLLLVSCSGQPTPTPVPPPAPSAVCPTPSTPPSPSAAPVDAAAPMDANVEAATPKNALGGVGGLAHLHIANDTGKSTTVFVTFGADTVVGPGNWSGFCTPNPSGCQFSLGSHDVQAMPLGGLYLNATFTFNHTATCGATKAEVNINNPKWYDIADVSLVDGYSDKIQITALEPAADAGADGGPTSTVLGPPVGREGNERVFGVFPLGCDICVARQSPPCGMKPGKTGCKTGSQYNPDVPCQYQGSVMGGGSYLTVTLVH